MSPFRLHRRIGPRPAFLGGDAKVKVVGAAPFVEPERRSSVAAHRHHQPDEPQKAQARMSGELPRLRVGLAWARYFLPLD